MERKILDKQESHWENMFSDNPEMFGEQPSEAAVKSAEIWKKESKKQILEIGGGQGRDTFYFAANGFDVTVIDYSEAGINHIQEKARTLGLEHNITAIRHDIRKPMPFDGEVFDAVFSHMLYCMALTTEELININKDILRVLRKDGLNIYTARNTNDAHYRNGIHRGEDLYEMNGFIVHFFSRDKVKLLSEGFEIISVDEFEEGELPRKLYKVILRKLG